MREEDAENITQDVFLSLWERRDSFEASDNTFSYLLTTTKHRCLNHLRHQVVELKAAEEIQSVFISKLQMNLNSLEALQIPAFTDDELEVRVKEALNHLPEQCRQIFVMSKLDGKKQKQIAEELNISVNTVETQMGIAYKKLRLLLKSPLALLLFL